jgi:hypothetical protein
MEKARITVGFLSGIGVKGVQEVDGSRKLVKDAMDVFETSSGISFEHCLAWFLAGLLGALGALVLNLTYKAIIKKVYGDEEAKGILKKK